MTDREILKKAFEKAYKENFADDVFEHDVIDYYADGSLTEDQYLQDIFSEDFAKAFWGEEKLTLIYIMTDMDCSSQVASILFQPSHWLTNYKYIWQYHLQQMVLEKDRLKYIEKFLK
ncbi:MAG: hypothetical protein JETCAE03_34500 [Ignavibacteriaceae bacterium]|jgi:hypothetical protein|nr:MAG: hypothetical protein JETCAE03_34500 [Ignavibacteriaceae bacterium]